MKRLVLVRHAKAVHWGYDEDFGRELTGRGEQDAGKVSSHLNALGIIPDLIITSPARRAMQTARIYASAFGYPAGDIKKEFSLYHGMTTDEFLNFLKTLPDTINTVFVFGHNPSLEFYAKNLCKIFNRDVPTCASVIIDFSEESWTKPEPRSGQLFLQVNPKDLTEV